MNKDGAGLAQRGQSILFSVVFNPFFPQPPRQCLAPTICHLSTLNKHCIAGASLPIHMMGEVSRETKRDELGLIVFNLLSTDKKENQIFLIYKEIQSGAFAKSYKLPNI
jgi:hypothetical protein